MYKLNRVKTCLYLYTNIFVSVFIYYCKYIFKSSIEINEVIVLTTSLDKLTKNKMMIINK